MLKVNDLTVQYGAIRALRGISFEVNEGEIVSLIGSNGAGKTTALHAISNIIRKSTGSVVFEDQDIRRLAPDAIVRTGLIQVPEGRRIFANMSVHENLEMGAYTRKDRAAVKKDMDKVFTLFPRLKERSRQVGGTLSGGEQQMLAMGRALMSKPKLLLLDEPSMGLAPILVDEIFSIIKTINADILETGRIIKSDDACVLIKDETVKKAYLGG